MIKMQLVDGEVVVTKVMADRLKDPNLYDKIAVDKGLVDLIGTIENAEGELELVDGDALEELQGNNKMLHEELRKSVDREKKWKRLVEEAQEETRLVKEETRQQLLEEQEQQISQLQAQCVNTLAEQGASAPKMTDDDKQAQLQITLAEQLEKEMSELRLQMEQEQ